MKTKLYLNKYFNAALLFLLCANAYGQSPYTVTKDTLGGDQVRVRIEHTNGRYVEHIIDGSQGETHVDFIDFIQQDNGSSATPRDILSNTIALPADDINSHPLDLYNAGSKVYCMGTKQLMVIDTQLDEASAVLQLGSTGNYHALDFLNMLPISKFLDGNETDGILYCADLANNLYFVDVASDAVLFSHSLNNYSEQISTIVEYDESTNRVFWLINSWESTNGTIILAFNGTNGSLIAQRYFDQELNDMIAFNGNLVVSESTQMLKLSQLSLNTISTSSGKFRKLFALYNNEFVAEEYIYNLGIKYFTVFDAQSFTPLQSLAGTQEFHYMVIPVETGQSFIYLSGGFFGGPYISNIVKVEKENDLYSITQLKSIDDYQLKSMSLSLSGNEIYCAGGNFICRIDMNTFDIGGQNSLNGCQNWDLELYEDQGNIDVLCANSREGTISFHDSDCSLSAIQQTAFKTSIGCFNPIDNKVYFVNNRITYQQSGIAIVDGSTEDVITTLPLGAYLTDVVYNEVSNNVAVTSKWDNELYFINGNTNQTDHTVFVPQPQKLFSYQDKVFCGTNSAIYVIDTDNNYSVTSFPLAFQSSVENCMDFELNKEEEKLYVLYRFDGDTYLEEIDLQNNTISQRKYKDVMDGYDVEYDPIHDRIYIGNVLMPKLYVIDPSTLDVLTEINYQAMAKIYQLDVEIDLFKNNAYLTYREISGSRKKTVIDLENSAYVTSNLNAARATQTFNALNDQVYHHDAALNNDNNFEVFVDVIDGMDGEESDNIATGNILSRNYSFYQDLYGKLSPIINTETNKIYWPNADFSNVSVINAYTDKLGLQSGWNWLSFPRLERAENDPASVIPVLDNINYFPDVELELNENGINYLRYFNNEWLGNLLDVISTDGYKLDLDILSDDDAPNMKLYGAILDPDTPITLYPGAGGNWVGYFIEDAQMPLDAIPAGVLQHVTQIKAQNWTMIHDISGDPEWRYKGHVTPIQYGQMVIIYVDQQQTLVWNQPQAAAEEMTAPETEYFEFEEQADYLPLFVETDSTSDIQEIAVLANGEVKGAAVREAGDTLTQVSAYLGGVPPGTPLTFETWDGYKSAPAQITGYAVYNPARKAWEPRTLYHGERAHYHVVSLKAGAAEVSSMLEAEVSCAPNPFNSETTFTVRVNQTAQVSLTIRDMNGRTVATLLDSRMPEGLFRATWDGTGSNGANAGNGVYYYHLAIDGRQQASGKIVLIR